MTSSIFSTFCSVSSLLLFLGALISPGFHQMIGSKWRNMAMANEDEDSMALLPFGSSSGIGSFVKIPQCGGPRRASVQVGRITVKNNCPRTIWPVTLTTGSEQPQLSINGFELALGESRSLNVPTPWTGRVWARTHCSNNNFQITCLTGDCGQGLECKGGQGGLPPATLVEFTLAPNGGQDFYDVSLVDGFNIPVSITTQSSSGPCESANCRADVNKVCPVELQVKTGNEVIGCMSACLAFNQPRYCCTGEFNDPSKCKPTNYSQIFKNQCPNAYSYAYDDKNSTFTCNNRPNYVITFCS